MKSIAIGILGLCAAMSLPAHATLITARASDYADGTDVTHAFEGLTIRSVYQSNGINYNPAYVVPMIIGNTTIIDTGLTAFNGPETSEHHSYPFNYNSALMATSFDARAVAPDCSHQCDAILIDLDQATDYVKVMGGTVGDALNPYESLFAEFFDADWNFLGGCYSLEARNACATVGSRVNGLWTVDVEWSTSTPLISHIVAGGQKVGFVTGLTYNRDVPEPEAFGLFLLGVMGTVGFAKSRTRSS